MNTTKYDGNKVVSWADVGWKPREAAPKVLKLSEAIRIGCATTSPTKDLGKEVAAWTDERNGKCFTCLIGAAWLGSGRSLNNLYSEKECIGGDWVRSQFGVPADIAVQAHLDYEYKGRSREQVADWLEAQGY